MKVKLINVGRDNINMTVDVKNSDALRREVNKYILSRNWDFEETDNPSVFNIEAGWRTVGQVEIIQS